MVWGALKLAITLTKEGYNRIAKFLNQEGFTTYSVESGTRLKSGKECLFIKDFPT
jgi:regulator of replication initiation timing